MQQMGSGIRMGLLRGQVPQLTGGQRPLPQRGPGSYARQPRPLPALPLHLPLQLLTAVPCAATISSEHSGCIANDHLGLVVRASVNSFTCLTQSVGSLRSLLSHLACGYFWQHMACQHTAQRFTTARVSLCIGVMSMEPCEVKFPLLITTYRVLMCQRQLSILAGPATDSKP